MNGLDLSSRLSAVVLTGLALLLAAVFVLTWRVVLPATLIVLLALGSGLVRTVALAGFLLLIVLRGLMLALDWAGASVPVPRLTPKAVTA